MIAGSPGRKRRGGDRRPAAAAMADVNEFDLSNYDDDVAPLPVLNNDSVPSFLKGNLQVFFVKYLC